MADNDNRLESKNKVLQSLDLYANDLLNVSKIIGNEYAASVRPRDLEITTSDVTSGTAGDLLLKAGLTTDESGLSGCVRVLAGSEEDNCFSSLTLNPDGMAFFQETEDLTEEAARINITGRIIGQSTDTSGVINIIGQSQVNIGEGQEGDFASLGNRIQLKEETRDNTRVSVLTVDTAEETHSIGTEFKVQNNLDPEHATSVFKVQAEDTGLSSDIGTGYRHEGIQADSNYIDIHAKNGLKISNDRADNYLSLTRDNSDPSAYLILGYSDDIQLQADNTVTLKTPQTTSDSIRYLQLNSTDAKVNDIIIPGLEVKNNYTDIQAGQGLYLSNNNGNKIALDGSGSAGGNFTVTTTTGLVEGTDSIKLQVPKTETDQNDRDSFILLQHEASNSNRSVQVQAKKGIYTTVLTGNDNIEVKQGDYAVTSKGLLDLKSDSEVRIEAPTDGLASTTRKNSNYLSLTTASPVDSSSPTTAAKLRANSTDIIVNASDSLIIENNPRNTETGKLDENPSSNYIKLTKGDSSTNPATLAKIETKSAILEETGTDSVIIKANGDNNKITLTQSNSTLAVVNSTETHSNTTGFNVKVPSTAVIGTSGSTFDLTTTTANLASGSVTVTTTGNYTLSTKGNVQQTLEPAASNTYTITATKSGDNAPANTLVFNQSDSSLTATNVKTTVNTSELHLSATTTTADFATLMLNVPSENPTFSLSADNTGSAVTVGIINNTTALNLGTSNTEIPVQGFTDVLDLTLKDTTIIRSTVNGTDFKFGFPVGSSPSTLANGQALLEVDHTAITKRAYLNNLDIYGNIRIGDFASQAAAPKITANGVATTFANYPNSTSAVLSSNSTQTIQINSGSLDLDLASTLDIDSIGALTVDSGTSIGIGTDANKHVPVTVDASHLIISGDSGNNGANSNSLLIDSNITDRGGNANRSVVKAETIEATSDFYGNNIHMYWDATTGSLVFAAVAAVNS